MIARIFSLLLLSNAVASATTYALRTLEQRWPDVDIIAIVNVSEVYTVTTPEGVTLQSAEAIIERMLFRRINPIDQSEKTKIRIYSLLPNGIDQGRRSLESGRTFVMMKQNGINTFFPTDPWEFQSLSSDEILWPTQDGIQKKTIVEVAREVEHHIDTLKNEQKR